MKLKSTTLNNLSILLNNISRENLYNESMTSVENKWKAMTLRSKISGLFKEANGELNDKIDKANDVLRKFGDEMKTLEAQYEEPKDEIPEDKKIRIVEKDKAFTELNERAEKEITKTTGLAFTWFLLPQRIGLAKFVKEGEDKDVEVKFDPKFKQLEFLKEQMEKNIFEIRVSDEVISDIATALEI